MNKVRTLRRLMVTLVLASTIGVSVGGCLLVPFPGWDGGGGHRHHHRGW